jgi:flagellin
VLVVQASNDTQDATSRGYITKEVIALLAQAEDIADDTKFNGIKILDGTVNAGTFTFHTGAYSGETQAVSIGDAQTAVLVTGAIVVATKTDAEVTITSMDEAIAGVDGLRATLGAAQNKLESNVRNISVTQVNIAAAESNIRDVDFAAESANFAKHNILAQSGSYAMSQANSVQQNVLRLLQ